MIEYKKWSYGDPTGGGDDITLSTPIWAKPPGNIVCTDPEGERLQFVLEGEADDD